MTSEDKDLIRCFAAGGDSLRQQAVNIHRRELKETLRVRDTPEIDFMAEVDNICPDYAFRSMYRKKIAKRSRVMRLDEFQKLHEILHNIFESHHRCALPKAERGLPKGRLCDECEDIIASYLNMFKVEGLDESR